MFDQTKKLPNGMSELDAAKFIADGDRRSLLDFVQKLKELGIETNDEQLKRITSYVYGMIMSAHTATLVAYC